MEKQFFYDKFVVPFWKKELKLKPPPIEMTAFNLTQTLELLNHPRVKEFHSYITSKFIPNKAKVALIVPCDAYKPYSKGTKSKMYKILYEIIEGKPVHMLTISDPLAIQPKEFHDFQFNGNPIFYDCIGMFHEFSRLVKSEWNEHDYKNCVEILAKNTYLYFSRKRNIGKYSHILAFTLKGRPENDIIERANSFLNGKITQCLPFEVEESFESPDDFFKNNQKIYITDPIISLLDKKMKLLLK